MKTKCKFGLCAYGDTFYEKAYSLLRHHASVIAKRQRTITRCKDCFRHGMRRDETYGVIRGCNGCAEMYSAIDDLQELFKSREEA